MKLSDLTVPLFELKNAPLYHYMGSNSVWSILQDNTLKDRKNSYNGAKALSLTRNKNIKFFSEPPAYVLILDQEKLTHRHKMKPVRGDLAANLNDFDPDNIDYKTREQEERLNRSIHGLNKYLKMIIVTTPERHMSINDQRHFQYNMKAIKEYSDQYNIPYEIIPHKDWISTPTTRILQSVNERQMSIPVYGRPMMTAINPSTSEVFEMLELSAEHSLRCVLHKGDLYVWDAHKANHYDVSSYLHKDANAFVDGRYFIEYVRRFPVFQAFDEEELDEALQNRNVIEILKSNQIKIYKDKRYITLSKLGELVAA